MIWLETLIELEFVDSSRSSSYFSIRAFRAYAVIESRQTALHRAIRGSSILSQQCAPPKDIEHYCYTDRMDLKMDTVIIIYVSYSLLPLLGAGVDIVDFGMTARRVANKDICIYIYIHIHTHIYIYI